MTVPQKLLDSLEGVSGFDRAEMLRAHEMAASTSVRINPFKVAANEPDEFLAPDEPYFTLHRRVPWAETGYYLQQRPSFTFDPLFHAGCYYVQEASSMFIEQALLQLTDASRPLKLLDLCAAPGGKSTHLLSLISSESLLVCNEVIRARSNILVDNIGRWGRANVVVSNNDPKAFGALTGYFDVLLVDAPCSGSGLFRKDEEALTEWSEANVELCMQRQQRILADALPCLREGGLLIYSTCSYSPEEDENIAAWVVQDLNMEALDLHISPEWNVVPSAFSDTGKGYRFYPYLVDGEGFFVCCFRKRTNEGQISRRGNKPEKISVKEREIVAPYIRSDEFQFIKKAGFVLGLPPVLQKELPVLDDALNLRYAGLCIGEIMKNRLVPDHSLALSVDRSDSIATFDVDYKNAIRYLQRKEMDISPKNNGWQIIRHGGYGLGWANALSNRVNNYYPKELRIRAESAAAREY